MSCRMDHGRQQRHGSIEQRKRGYVPQDVLNPLVVIRVNAVDRCSAPQQTSHSSENASERWIKDELKAAFVARVVPGGAGYTSNAHFPRSLTFSLLPASGQNGDGSNGNSVGQYSMHVPFGATDICFSMVNCIVRRERWVSTWAVVSRLAHLGCAPAKCNQKKTSWSAVSLFGLPMRKAR